MLSNTATPKYYAEFRDRVIRGEEAVCENVSLQMNRIEERISDPQYYYDEDAVEGFIEFCEGELTLTDGGDVTLLDSFKLWAEDVLGWYYFVERSVPVPNADGIGTHYEQRLIKKRLCNKQYLIVGRGAAKSMYSSFWQSYTITMDTTTTDQIITAPTMVQSNEIMMPIQTALVRAKGPVYKLLTSGDIHNTTGSALNKPKLASTKEGVKNFLTNSLIKIRPMSKDKLQGSRCVLATIDEWLSGDVREDVVSAIEQGASKNLDWLIIATSSEGTVRNSVGDTIKMELTSILKGDYRAPHVSIWWYRLDDIKEVSDPSMWIKANPNLGKTVSYDTYQMDVERAENSPANRNDILAKRFGLPMEGYTYYFTYGETLVHNRQDFYGMTCSLGGDLSQGDDFCSFTFLFPLRNGCIGVKTLNYITSRTFERLSDALRNKYQEFIDEGSLVVMDGAILDIPRVYENLDNHIQRNQYTVAAFGYDPYNSREFLELYERDNGPYNIVKVPQGVRTESVPLGEIKKYAEDRMLLFDEGIMQFAMGNCIALVDTNGNRKLAKMRREEKIDPVAALLDGYVAMKANLEAF